jgi:hypothetical protein
MILYACVSFLDWCKCMHVLNSRLVGYGVMQFAQHTYGIGPAAYIIFGPRLHVHAFALEAQDLVHNCVTEKRFVCI